jgi:hypothetical protein
MKTLRGAVVLGCLAVAGLLSAQSNTPTERFTAAAINTNNGAAGSVEFVVNRWSTDAERARLMQTLLDKGPEKLLDTLQDMPRLGFIRATNGGLGYDLRYALKEKGEDGGERIVLATDRRIGFWEASHQPRSIDYPFTVIEMRLNADGEGEGKLSLATKITASKDKRTVTLENYELQPVLLKSIRRERAGSR